MQNNVLQEIEKLLTEKFRQPIFVTSWQTIGGGCINNALKISTSEGDYFVKWNANCQPDIFLREAESLRELKKAAGNQLVIPEVLGAKMVDSSPGFLIQEYLPPRFSIAKDEEQLGRGLAFIHQYKNEKFGFFSDNYCGATHQKNAWTENWALFYRDVRLGFLLKLIQQERSLTLSEIKIFEKLQRKIPKLLPEKSVPVLIHGDLWSGNYLITEKGPALIDPASYFADREMEFGIITMFGGFSNTFYDAYNEVNPLPSDWKERNKLYQLYHVLNHYYLFGGAYKQQALQIARFYLE